MRVEVIPPLHRKEMPLLTWSRRSWGSPRSCSRAPACGWGTRGTCGGLGGRELLSSPPPASLPASSQVATLPLPCFRPSLGSWSPSHRLPPRSDRPPQTPSHLNSHPLNTVTAPPSVYLACRRGSDPKLNLPMPPICCLVTPSYRLQSPLAPPHYLQPLLALIVWNSFSVLVSWHHSLPPLNHSALPLMAVHWKKSSQ